MGHHDRRGGFLPGTRPRAASDPREPEHVGEPAPGVAREGFAAAATGAAGWTAASAFFRAPGGAALASFPAVLTRTAATLGRKPEWIFQRRRRRDAHRWVQPGAGRLHGRATRTLASAQAAAPLQPRSPTPDPEAAHSVWRGQNFHGRKVWKPQMSSSDGRSRIQDRGYSEVPGDMPGPDGTLRTLQSLHNSELAVSADPLPPPPLPLQPPFGPSFYSSDTEEPAIAPDLKPVRRFVPDSWKNFFRGKKKDPEWDKPVSDIRYISDGVECSPPASPARPNHLPSSSYKDPSGGSEGTVNSPQEADAMFPQDPYASLDRRTQTARTYSEKVEEYNLRYAYMKSWAGLLRILGVAELLLGAGVFACVTAYIHKDNEWYNLFGYTQPYGTAGLGSLGSTYGGYYYSGPKTPFVLVVAGLAWIATIIILVLGMSMYYRTILLDSNWWPLTEFGVNVALFILYMAAAIVYVNDTNRGGLCYYPLFNTPMNAVFCRVEGGQIAAMIFLFVTMIVYLISALVCLKLWRHETARRHREYMERQEINEPSLSSKRRMFDAATSDRQRDQEVHFKESRTTKMTPELLSGHIPPGYIPKPIVMPDYVAKYPVIRTDDDRERYKAVFQDQFSEYKELSAEVQAILRKFDELDIVMSRLPRHSENLQEHERISRIHEEFRKKKNDPSFLEKKERCDYLKNKLSHIKQRIQEYDKVMNWDTQGYS